MSVLSEVFRDNRFRPKDLPGFESKLFFEGEKQRPFLVKFFVLLSLSSIIAVYGVLNDSPATVIGAMIVAPLMTPIMATSAALVMGSLSRTIISLLLVAAGVAVVVGISWLVGVSYGVAISFDTNTQIVGRIYPRTTDLAIALASGAAGAFAFSRDDITDSLPGVAIAISLVPPLCVLGLSLSESQWQAAWGSALLFMTNFLAILLAGGGVLAFLGLGKAATQTLTGVARRRAFYSIGIGVLLVTIPLTVTSVRVARDSWVQSRTTQVMDDWLQGSRYSLRAVKVSEDGITVIIAGAGTPPSIEDLKGKISRIKSKVGSVELQIVPIDIKHVELSDTD
ncbi:MAG: DUF389 domain-containing protein [Gammaproteobacteria bacterium]|nr:MAG: DUF389 domain-containing protein [Gammaproteobacteria bacterium]